MYSLRFLNLVRVGAHLFKEACVGHKTTLSAGGHDAVLFILEGRDKSKLQSECSTVNS